MKKDKKALLLISILVLTLVGGVYYFNTQQQELSFNAVYLPDFVSIWCGRLPQQATTSFTVSDISSSICGDSGKNSIDAYTPNGCDYVVKGIRIRYRIVSENTDCDSVTFSWFLSSSSNTIIPVPYKQKICFESNLVLGGAKIQGSATAYGLTINSKDGKVIFTKNCDLKSNIKNIKNIDYIPGFSDTPILLTPDNSVNHYIVGYSPSVNNKDVVTRNGKRIYINSIGSYFPIEKSKNGYYYANSLKVTNDDSIICVPSNNPMCIDGTKIQTENQPCSMFNKPSGYVGIGNNVECDYTCLSGHLKENTCRQKAICSGNTPWRNPITNKCESAGYKNYTQDKQCGWNQESYKTINYDYGTLNWREWVPFAEPIKVSESGCKTAGWFYMAIIVLFLLIAIAIVKFLPKRKQ